MLSSAKPKLVISACLLGEYCRYDGKTKTLEGIAEYYKDYEIIPFCPEAPVFGTPRERIYVQETKGHKAILTEQTQKDVTALLEEEIYRFIDMHPKVDAIILKAKSPSCGFKTTPLYDAKKQLLAYGSGIAANIFAKHYTNTEIKDENNYF